MQNIFLLGSTGSIGTRTLDVVRNNKDKYKIYALQAHSNIELLLRQAAEFSPAVIVVTDRGSGEKIKNFLPANTRLFVGAEHLPEIAAAKEVDTVVAAAAGISSIETVISALINRKKVALANKEVLVAAGSIISGIARGTNQKILPVDSEHSAVFQCIDGNRGAEINRLILTASGGPFRETSAEELAKMTAADTLRHPTWSMGKKITIDSATMFNKGLEVIEAWWLFDVPEEKIDVLVHPQSIVHSMVEFSDRNTLAVLSHPDMYLPISYALSYPERIACAHSPLALAGKSLDFFAPDGEKFPMLPLARKALKKGGLAPAVINAANDVSVELFLEGKIKFLDIYKSVNNAYERFDARDTVTVENIKKITAEVAAYTRSMK